MELSPRFEQALQYASILHAGQLRKGTSVPYISHLLAVAGIVLENGANEDEAIAALLHDVVEDAGGQRRLADIRARFGEVVAAIVDACTDADVIPKPPWRARKEKHLAHLRKASPSVRLVTAADKLHNARSVLSGYRELGESLWERFNGKKEGTLWYYREMAKALEAGGRTPLTEELRRTVEELHRLAGSNEF